MGVRLTVVGCSPAWPNPGGAQSGYLIEGAGRLLVDCGPGVLSRLRAREGWPRLDGIVISHFHLDHWGDLVPWAWGTIYGAGGATPELWVPPGGVERLAELGAEVGTATLFADVFPLREYPAAERFAPAGYDVTPFAVPHYDIPTFALRIECDGRALAYSADSAPTPQLARAAAAADLFLCEATLATGELDPEPRGHLSADEAATAAREAGARRLLLTHRPVELPLPEGLEQARDGLELDV